MILARVSVRAVSRPSPSFVRIELGGRDLADFGVDGPLYDQRIKLVLPGPTGLPDLDPDRWWTDLQALPPEVRGHVRTYTVADVHGHGAGTTIVVDVVLHPGEHGPGSAWAAVARPGDEVLAVVPRRGHDFGGIEFRPGGADRVLLVADETALPAVVQILRELPGGVSGSVFVEVPLGADVPDLPPPPGVTITWLPRNGRPVGAAAVAAVSAHLGFRAEGVEDESVDPDVWETPTYSSSGEEVDAAAVADGRYAWIAGESAMVTTLRRHLVGRLGMPRSQVAFMGYWRQGVAMRG